MPRTKPADERRTDLLDAGQALFVGKGVSPTTLDDITRQAGVAKGTFYLYFRSKDDLLSALQERFDQSFAAQMVQAANGTDDWPAKLDACVEACFTYYVAHHDLHDVLFHHPGHPPGSDAKHMGDGADNRVVDTLQDLLVAGTNAGAFHVDDPDLTAVLLYSAVHHAFDASFHGSRVSDDARLIAATQQLFRRAAGCS
jgi:TetR/AcrR family transcriptional repressor of nem operon